MSVKGANRKARNPERREIPNGAEFRRARSSRKRNYQERGTARSAGGAGRVQGTEPRALVAFSSSALRDFAQFGIQRSLEFSAPRDFALFRWNDENPLSDSIEFGSLRKRGLMTDDSN